jgi:hypothetical protein
MFGSLAIAQWFFAGGESEQSPGTQAASSMEGASGSLPALPPMPQGKTTVIGGTIHDVDPVRDQFTLKVFGGRPLKILFDERTQVYRDGARISLHDLHSDDHASVETVLDGTNVFALEIRMLSRPSEGEFQGQVLNFNPERCELTVSDALSRASIKLNVPSSAPIVRVGQDAFSSAGHGSSDLVKGTLISVKFESDNNGRGVASQITILASPGSSFVLSGDVSVIDVRSGLLVVVDPREDKSYQVFVDSGRFPISRELHEGTHVTVTAKFDGARYLATAIAVN